MAIRTILNNEEYKIVCINIEVSGIMATIILVQMVFGLDKCNIRGINEKSSFIIYRRKFTSNYE